MTNPFDYALDFTGKHVVVIGGSSGIGNGIAHALRRRLVGKADQHEIRLARHHANAAVAQTLQPRDEIRAHA